MKDYIPQFVLSFGDNKEVVSIAEKLERFGHDRITNRVYNFLCLQYGIIKTIANVENVEQRGWLMNAYRHSIKNGVPTTIPDEFSERMISILYRRMREVFDSRQYSEKIRAEYLNTFYNPPGSHLWDRDHAQ